MKVSGSLDRDALKASPVDFNVTSKIQPEREFYNLQVAIVAGGSS
ncbi:hypothetical protein CEV34_1223 [Brucella pseudogrignonensis]|uniref:Uncharacterized protein n=1 Tax=Brucella pseudogrignonensis TaxID=419475 RepID=A0A256GMZ2_9HYPH|nr:hypothetical protein CEV34_1223 [Brucella pseudogrignonensis]